MKKLTAIFVALLLLPLYSSAMVDSEYWSYVFHLEYSQGALRVDRNAEFAYSPIPVQYAAEYRSDETDFYGVLFNMKNKEEARFGFMAPTTTVAALGKSIMNIAAPKFADVDHVSFYTKTHKHLFDVSVAGSSFCNDNGRCDANVGESYMNCPLDCPTPPADTVAPTLIGLGASEPPPSPLVTQPPTPAPDTAIATTGDTSYVATGTLGTVTKNAVDIKTILSFVGGLLVLILAFILYRVKKNIE